MSTMSELFDTPYTIYLQPSTFYLWFIILANAFINIYAFLFLRAPSLESLMIVFYENPKLNENAGFYFLLYLLMKLV